jgi:hypothetical protein
MKASADYLDFSNEPRRRAGPFKYSAYLAIAIVAFIAGLALGQCRALVAPDARVDSSPAAPVQPHPRSL